jgi:hypothetical protein
MSLPTRLVATLATAALAVSLQACSSSKASTGDSKTPTGSSSDKTTPAANSTSSTPTTTDYNALLLTASDVPVPGVTEGTPAAPPQGTGASVAFTATGGRSLGDTVLVLPDASAAQTASQSSVTAAKQGITGAEVTDAPIGDGGTAIRGTTSTGAVAVLIFTEGKALVVLEFDSPASDPVPTDLIQQIATAQDNKIKAQLPS